MHHQPTPRPSLPALCSEVAAAYTLQGSGYSVYCLMCTITSKCYIGITRRQPEERLKEHRRKAPYAMRKDARRYKPFDEHFKMLVLAETGSKAEAELLEEFFIWKFDTVARGYNTCFAASDCYLLGRPRHTH